MADKTTAREFLQDITEKLDKLIELNTKIAEELPASRLERRDLMQVISGKGQVPINVFLAVVLALSAVIIFVEIKNSDTKLHLGISGAEIETSTGEKKSIIYITPEN